jgi:hypothetical protein
MFQPAQFATMMQTSGNQLQSQNLVAVPQGSQMTVGQTDDHGQKDHQMI